MSTEAESKNPEDNWRLQKIELEYQRWGENKGTYTGKIVFQNGVTESFSFNLRPEMARPYIALISSEIVMSAESLSSRLIDSLGISR